MTTTQFKDIRPGKVFFTAEMIGSELRETFYIRDHDRECRYPMNVAIGRFGIVQGEPLSSEPRYVRILPQACRDLGEADGRTPCRPIEQSTFYPFLHEK